MSKPPEPNKTLLGLPSDMQAALQRLREAEDAKDAQSGLRQTSDVSPLGQTKLENPWNAEGQGQGHDAAGRSLPPPLPGQRPALPPIVDPAPGAKRIASMNRTLIGVVPADLQALIEARATAAASTPAAQPPTAREPVEPPLVQASRVLSTFGGDSSPSQPSAASEREAPTEPDHAPDRQEPLRLASFEDDHPRRPSDGRMAPREQLRLDRERDRETAPHRPPSAPKRWPALLLLGLVAVGGVAVVVLRVPQLLPQPLAALLGSRTPAPESGAPIVKPAAPVPPSTQTDVSAATALPVAAPAPRSVAAKPMLEGASAELERQAIELLRARDYSGATRLYTQLRAAEPGRPEYAVMLDLLAHNADASCGQAGQD
ncbi:MAG: hypothetical protein ABW321_30175, partial [Polyangiales bacterium]